MRTRWIDRRLPLSFLGLMLLLGVVGEVQGQVVEGGEEGVSLLTLLDSDRTIESGLPHTGALETGDFLLPSGERVEGWSFEGTEGEIIRIDLASEDVDAYLYLVGPGLGAGLFDDDSGGGLNSRICTLLPATGRYWAVASALGEGVGEYTITLDRSPSNSEGVSAVEGCEGFATIAEGVERLLEAAPLAGTLQREAGVGGLLDPFDPRHPSRGGPVEIWEYAAEEGEVVAFDLASESFDTYLLLTGPGLDEELFDDDGGVGCTGSRIWVTFPASGAYHVVVTTFDSGEEGEYRLIATETPTLDLDCDWEAGSPPSIEGLAEVEIHPSRRISREAFPLNSPGALPSGGTAISGIEVQGILSPEDVLPEQGLPVQGWGLEVGEGEGYRIELESEDFDPYLIVTGPGLEDLLWNDDGEEGLDSRVEFVAPESGEFRIFLRTAGGEGSGNFTLRMMRWVEDG